MESTKKKPAKARRPTTSAERQAVFRAKNAANGLTEVRGVFAPTELHSKIKASAKRALLREANN